MEIEIKEIEPCKLTVHYVAGAEEILNKRGEIINSFKKAPVPGFRTGKASVDAIKMHYRNQIEESLKRALAEDAYHNTLFEKKLRPHGAPRFNSLLLTDGRFTCDFDLHTKPDFELAPFIDMEVPRPHASRSIEQVTEELMQELRVRFGEAIPYIETDFVQHGDNVIIDYEGSVDGVKVEQLSATGEMLTVGRSSLTQFDDNILGMSLGETREFDLIVPTSGLPSLAGKTVHVSVSLTMGSKNIPCPLNDELAHKLGKKDFLDLKEFVHATAGASIQSKYIGAVNEAVANRLVDNNSFEVPNWLALSEAQYLVNQAKMDWVTLDDLDKEKYLEMGTRNVKLSLVLDRIRDTNPEAQLTDQEVFDVIKKNLAKTQTDTPLDDVIQKMNKSGYLQILFSRIRDEHTMDFITKTIKVID